MQNAVETRSVSLPVDGSRQGDSYFEGVFDMRALKNLLNDEKGLESVEYAVVLGLVVAATVAAISALSSAVQGKFTKMATTINNS